MIPMSTMSDHESAEYARILTKRMVLSSLLYAGNSADELPEELLLTEAESDFYENWLPHQLARGVENFRKEMSQSAVLTKRQKANAKRREAKHGSVEPRHYQRWMPNTHFWQKLHLAWVEKPEILGFVQELICPDCKPEPEGDCEDCAIEAHYDYAQSMRSQSLREQENRFLAHYGEPEIRNL
jgi:hypothetical protein